MNLKKLIPIFLLLAAFFLVALWASISYNQARLNSIPKGQAQVIELWADHANPDHLIIQPGEIVQFNVKDGQTHSLFQGKSASDPTPAGLESGEFQPDEGYRWQLSQAGNYYFYDHLNPKINIEIVVYAH